MFDSLNKMIVSVMIIGLGLVANSPVTLSSDVDVPQQVFFYKIHYQTLYKQFQKIKRLHQREKYYGVIMPDSKNLQTTLYKTKALKITNSTVVVGTVCKVVNYKVLDLDTHFPEVNCGRKGKGFLRHRAFAYDVILNISSNKSTMTVTWKISCGSDSCSTKDWVLSSKRINNKRNRGWMRELKQRDGFFIPTRGEYILFTVLSSHMFNSPKEPKIYIQDLLSQRSRFLVRGLSPAFHPNGKLIFYRDSNGSVFVTTITAKNSIQVFQSPYSEKSMYYKGSVISAGQAPVKFIHSSRILIKFSMLDSNKEAKFIELKIRSNRILRLLKSR
ncbi:hypothetical protein MNBD_GAMMA12-3256 [hydrothermal vent metagenome]|uniref:Uncharacterized protein n=1 Tax=hydrothermal vent metagenome TaxID=652676 RepID=A0A3B0YVV2_9ZZZZ